MRTIIAWMARGAPEIMLGHLVTCARQDGGEARRRVRRAAVLEGWERNRL